MRGLLRRLPVGCLLLCTLLAWFNCGDEEFRIGHYDQLTARWYEPWQALRAYVSRDSDEHLYWEYSCLALGEDADLDYLASKRQGDREKNRADIAAAITHGPDARLPYRDFELEYPPLPLVAMLAPRVIADDLPSYRLAFGVLMAALVVASSWLAGLLSRELGANGPPRPWRRVAWFVAAIGPILVGRFDVLPALLVVGALLLVVRDRPFGAGLVLGAAVLAKLYPVLLLAPWLALYVAERRPAAAVRLVVGTAISIAVLSLPFVLIAPSGFVHSTFLYGARPFQVESLVGAIGVLVAGKSAIVGSFGSYNVDAPAWLGQLWGPLLPLAVVGCAVAVARVHRLRPSATPELRADRFVAVTAATLCLVLVTSKVLSPQYLLWLLPVVAIGPRRVFGWAVAAALMTQVFYPLLYGTYVDEGSAIVAAIVLVRDVMLIALAVRCVQWALGSRTIAISRQPT